MRKVDKNTQDIDFVITWVDGNDLEWKREKAARLGHTDMDISVNADNRKERYRDWDNLRYWFRGMEKYAPWVRKVHFVTWGHIPQWLNTKHPKLNIVCHEDFIPQKFTLQHRFGSWSLKYSQTFYVRKPEKFRSILFKGLWVSSGLRPAKPSAHTQRPIFTFFTASKMFRF